MASYIFGGNTGETPESVRQKRQLADMLLGRTQGAKNWGEGFGAIASGLASRWNREAADEGERAGVASATAGWQDAVRRALGGDTSSLASYGGSVPSVPQTADAQAIRQGLIDRGLPDYVADGFLLNMQDESGLDPGINEQNPTVPGSRGGYGLYQLTGPRRVAYEQFAAQQGVDPSDVNAQLDFLMSELQGPESRAAQSIFATKDAGSAAAAIARDFLRPAQQHLDTRVAKYMGGNAGPTQVASLDPSIGMPSGAPQVAAQPQMQAVTPQVAQTQTPPQQVAQTGGNADLQYLMQAASNPWLSDGQRSVINTLIEQQLQQQDPMRQLQMRQAQQGLEKGQLEINALRNPVVKPVEVNGRLVNPQTGQVIADYSDPKTATVGNSVIDVNTGQPIYRGQPEATSNMKDYDAYAADERSAGRQPLGRLEYEQAVRQAGAANTNVTIAGDKAWDQESAKLFAKRYDDLTSAAMNAEQMMGMYDLAQQALDSGIRTGLGADAELTLRQFGQSLGLDTDPEKIAGGELIRSVQNRMALLMRSPDGGMGMPGALSDRDIRFLKDSQIGLDRSPEGNRKMLAAYRAMEQRKVDLARLADQYVMENGRLDVGFNKAVREYAEANPLFGAPAATPNSPQAPQSSAEPGVVDFSDYFR